ncbi:ferritin-like domain-containing protein [Haliangium ochraceum]|uniref:Iminophenyl-pyruvate dimer synthase domain-containing protein n=1 Tax=Haliangium ochraceum (strain DSM 14365 / JCM 11303 / SMP-2) TaxID=502025 RepID=D0LW11_HALO1|nr:ferritin-like protein [Haliangium ochraceum]ACY14145.1 hypothetical protein Hoch_1595 [Haliangium ochraceum DSM 14365]
MLLTVTPGTIPDNFEDPYLNLIFLLNQAAGLEHSLMAAYLYAAFSIKDRYAKVRGDVGRNSYLQHSPGGPGGVSVLQDDFTLLEVCIEEMQHLGVVNRFLGALGGSPSFEPQEFPLASDVYPFAIVPMPLDRYAAATFLWMEAASCTLSEAEQCQDQNESPAFIAEVLTVLHEGAKAHHGFDVADESVSHLGTLYSKILEVARTVSERPPSFVPPDLPWGKYLTQLDELMLQGELGHYRMFRRLFTGEAFGGDSSIWADPERPEYPSLPLVRGTAYKGHNDTFTDESIRRLAWLSDLHYWIVLSLLDTAYRYADPYDNILRKYQYKAIDNMVSGFWPLGLELARRGAGAPFDAIGTQYTLGRDRDTALDVVELLIYEARGTAQRLASDGLLPADYRMDVFDSTLDGLQPPVGS